MHSAHLSPNATIQAAAGRLRGALFMIGFGGAWIAMWCLNALHSPRALAVAALAAAVWMSMCVARLRQLRGQLGQPTATAEDERLQHRFHQVNVGQWVAAALAIVGLNLAGHPELITAAVILIVGLHFFPLAVLFGYRAHHVTGAALVIVALAFPLLAAGGAKDPVGCLGAGVILWGSAIWSCLQARAHAAGGRFAHAH